MRSKIIFAKRPPALTSTSQDPRSKKARKERGREKLIVRLITGAEALVRMSERTDGPPPDFPNCGRLCFAAHVASTPHTYSGGYNQQLASNIQYEFTFDQAVRYKIVAVQLQRVEIDASGQMTASLE